MKKTIVKKSYIKSSFTPERLFLLHSFEEFLVSFYFQNAMDYENQSGKAFP